MNTLIGEYVRALRERRGLTQTELGRKSSIEQSTISRIERSKYIPKREMVEALAQVLVVDNGILLGAAGYLDEIPRATPIELAVMRQYVNTLSKGGA
jgi:transcriptional regulator with XRE-family HTH domain